MFVWLVTQTGDIVAQGTVPVRPPCVEGDKITIWPSERQTAFPVERAGTVTHHVVHVLESKYVYVPLQRPVSTIMGNTITLVWDQPLLVVN